MENENKEVQGSVEESELQEKVRQDVSEKIAEAAAEVQDEIDSAAEAVEVADEDAENVDFDAEALAEAEEEVAPVKEPKKVTLTLSNLVLSLIGTAVIGAIILLVGMQIPGWVRAIPEGATLATVEGTKITEPVMEYYLYQAASEYLSENGGAYNGAMADFDWEAAGADGKTAEEVVVENAKDMMEEAALVLWATRDTELDWDEASVRSDSEYTLSSTKRSLEQQVGKENIEEMFNLMLKASGFASEKSFIQVNLWQTQTQAATTAFQANSEDYYPEDKSVLEQYLSEDTAAYRVIYVAKETKEDEAEQAASNEEARAKAQELLDRVNNGEDFEAVVSEGGSDASVKYLSKTNEPDEMETAVFALKANEVSGIVEDEDGFYIAQRVVGDYELYEYWKTQAGIKLDDKKIAKISLKEVLSRIETAGEDFQTKLTEYQTAK
ncbi:MAG: peptidylprolyl isomerase [Clostridia bacterium]|nr:peptidylprolyl isomerase [Clostridia bacterium]